MRDLSKGGGDALDVVLCADQIGRTFEIVTAAAFEAEEVGSKDGFPKHGTFIKCRQPDGNDCWVELAQDFENQLAERLEEVEADGGTLESQVFRVASARKTPTGEWNYVLEWFDSFDEASESL